MLIPREKRSITILSTKSNSHNNNSEEINHGVHIRVGVEIHEHPREERWKLPVLWRDRHCRCDAADSGEQAIWNLSCAAANTSSR